MLEECTRSRKSSETECSFTAKGDTYKTYYGRKKDEWTLWGRG